MLLLLTPKPDCRENTFCLVCHPERSEGYRVSSISEIDSSFLGMTAEAKNKKIETKAAL